MKSARIAIRLAPSSSLPELPASRLNEQIGDPRHPGIFDRLLHNLIDDLRSCEHLSHYHLAHLCPCRSVSQLGRIPDARASHEKALALARQEPERGFLAMRLKELKLNSKN